MNRKYPEYDIHHRIAKSRGGTNQADNKVRLKRNYHESFHHVFSNMLPHEQIQNILELNAPIFTNGFKQKLYGILAMEERDIYIDGVKK